MGAAIRYCSVLFFLCLFLGVAPGFCQDILIGKILRIDSDKMEFEVVPLSPSPSSLFPSDNDTILVRIAKIHNLAKDDTGVSFPGCVVVGESVRLWGTQSVNDDHLFLTTDIRGCRGGGCSDPTGVRSRLLRARHRRSIADSEWQDSDVDGVNGAAQGGNGRGGNGGGSGGSGGGGGGSR